MRRFTTTSLSTLLTLFLDICLKNELNYPITDVFNKNYKLSVLLNYTSMFKHISGFFSSVSIVDFKQVNVCWVR